MKRLWTRLGDLDSYSPYDTLKEVIEFFKEINLHGPLTRANTYGFQNKQFRGLNYISLFWGDIDAQAQAPLSDVELIELNSNLNVGGIQVISRKELERISSGGNRIGWLDSCNMPSHIHRTINGGQTTVCGHTPRNPEYEATEWKITRNIPKKKHGISNFCRECFQNGGKTLLWITA